MGMSNTNDSVEQLHARIEHLKEERRIAMNALDIAVGLGQFDTRLNTRLTSKAILEQTAAKLRSIFPLRAQAYYLVNEQDASFYQAYCDPGDFAGRLERERRTLVEDYTFSWALSRNRPVFTSAIAGGETLVLHALATPRRTRGMFLGLFHSQKSDLHDYTRYLLTVVLLTCANYLESQELYRKFKKMNVKLENKVQNRTIALQQTNNQLQKEIKERECAEKKLRENEEQYRGIFENTGSATIICDHDNTIILSNKEFEHLSEYDRQEINHKKSIVDFISQKELKTLYNIISRIPSSKKNSSSCEFTFYTKNKKIKHVTANISYIPYTKQYIFSFIDITYRKKIEEKLRFLSYHDGLTKLYNRAYFEKILNNWNIRKYKNLGIVICDIDDLKFINDTFGHKYGDNLIKTTSEILCNILRKDDIIARIGGDEFAAILPDIDKDKLGDICERIKKEVQHYNERNPDIYLSLSVGSAISPQIRFTTKELLQIADNNMYKDKIQTGRKHSHIVQSLLKVLEARDFLTNGHCDRLRSLVSQMGARLGLSEPRMNDLQLFAQFHDIGKVGIPDRILFKPDALTPDEYREIQEHPEIGYRIALACPDLSPIADFILKHHEWWNGQGYPSGLHKRDIPLECRILAIADAFDAMTSERPYRKEPLPTEQAIAELRKCAGSQFDPELVEIFVETVRSGPVVEDGEAGQSPGEPSGGNGG
jgi:diguanylate cyclase (GGDEF)-like protein/PAS domain S-box-containing protein